MAENTEEQVVVETAAAATLSTKSAALAGIIAATSTLSHEAFMQWAMDAAKLAGTSNGSAEGNAASLNMKPSAASGKVAKEDAELILKGEELSEEKQAQVLDLIEQTVEVRVSLIQAKLEEEMEEKVVARVAETTKGLVEETMKRVDHAAKEWVEENKVAIETTLKVQRAERIIEGLRALVSEANIEVSTEAVDAVAEITAKAEGLQRELDNKIDENIELQTQVDALVSQEVFREVSEGLAMTEVEKFKKLVEDVELGSDREKMKAKLSVLREAHFKKEGAAVDKLNEQVAGWTGEEAPAPEKVEAPVSPQMQRLAESISRAARPYDRR